MTAPSRKAAVHQAPLVFEPAVTHETTMIVLHGRGSTAERFAESFLTSSISEVTGMVFKDCFPNTKFVFPTAPLRKAVAFNRSLTHQWFDKWSSQHPELKEHLQVPGLRETSTYIHELLQQEIDVIGAPNVALVGLSQGCASSLVATLLWDREPFGAVVGMCGYLPFRQCMIYAVIDEDDDEDNPFTDDTGATDEAVEEEGAESRKDAKFNKAVRCLCEELEMDNDCRRIGPPAMQSIPVFMGHGTKDTVVSCEQGRQAARFLGAIDINAEWKEYEGLGHWYSEQMLRDIIDFLRLRKGWERIVPTKAYDSNWTNDQHDKE